MVAHSCNPSYSGGQGRRITWTWEARLQWAKIVPLHSSLGNRARLSQKLKKDCSGAMWRMGYRGARLNVGQSTRKLLGPEERKLGAGTRMTVTVERSGQILRKQTNRTQWLAGYLCLKRDLECLPEPEWQGICWYPAMNTQDANERPGGRGRLSISFWTFWVWKGCETSRWSYQVIIVENT